MIDYRPALHGLAAAALVVASMCGVAAPARAQDDDAKTIRPLAFAEKVVISDDDRRVASEFLAAHRGDLRSAPPLLQFQVRTTRRWSRDCESYAVGVPKRLANQLPQLPEGLVFRIFDRSLFVVSRASGEVVDWVDAADE